MSLLFIPEHFFLSVWGVIVEVRQPQHSKGCAMFCSPSNAHLHLAALPDRDISMGNCRGLDLQQRNFSSYIISPHHHSF